MFGLGQRKDYSGNRALIVDDLKVSTDVLAFLLHKYKIDTCVVSNGFEAIGKISNRFYDYDAVFVDYKMPGIDGVDTVSAIRAIGTEYAKNVPIIAVTLYADVETEKVFFEKGIQAFLSKPVTAHGLDAIVHKFFKHKQKEA